MDSHTFGCLFVFLFYASLSRLQVTATCASRNASILDFLPKRLAGKPLTDGESAICDYYLPEQWYSMYNYTLASTPDECGTDYNWYRTGPLPTVTNVEEPLEMCRNGITDKCDRNLKARTMLCDDGTYIFFLPYVLGCPEAYCIESRDNVQLRVNDQPPKLDGIVPVLEADTVYRSGQNVLEFYCDFTPASDTSLFFTATYAVSTGAGGSVTNELYVSQPAQYQNKTQFRQMVKMTEKELQMKIPRPLGITMLCYIQASYQAASAMSNQVKSVDKFIGIECLNPNTTISRNGPLQLQFRPTVPFGCKKGGSKCELHIELYTPPSTHCKMPQPSLKLNPQSRIKCGLVISNDVNKTYNITIHSLQGANRQKSTTVNVKFSLFLRTIDNYVNHPLFGGYQLNPIPVYINDAKPKELRDSQCYSYNDPRVWTFDGSEYSIYDAGTFIMYKSTSLEQEVQTKTVACVPNERAKCNCGVAVRAGRDLYVFDLCATTNPKSQTGMFRVCEHGLLIKEIDASTSSQTLILPSGTTVNIYRNRFKYLNINIVPSADDFNNTEGLCGLFDGIKTNDDDASTYNKWRVRGLDLFNWRNNAMLNAWSTTKYLCTCPEQKKYFESQVVCDADTQKVCDYDYKTRGTHRRCSSTRSRIKRDGTKHFKMVHDFYRSHKTAFVSKLERQMPTPEVLSKRSVQNQYTNETAYADCMGVINTTAFRMCDEIPGLNFSSFITHCVLDAIDSNSMVWTKSYLEGIKSKCVYEIKAEQPPPPEAYEGLTVEINGTTFENITEFNVTLPEEQTIPEFSEENLNTIENVVCLNECSHQGKCVNGTCECYESFIGKDCSVDASLPPEMFGIPDEGLCDYQQRPCNTIYIFANNIADTGFMCRLTPFLVISDEVTYQEEDTIDVPGVLGGFSEVACRIANHRANRSTQNDFPNEIIAIGYRASLTNNNNSYSEEDTVVHFDSDCLKCGKIAGKVTCKEQPGFCVSGGRCYEVNETHECFRCSRHSDETLVWQPACENDTATTEPDVKKEPITSQDIKVILSIVCAGVVVLRVAAWIVVNKM